MDEAALLAARLGELEGRFELLLGERRAVGLLRAQGEDPSADYDLANKKYVDGCVGRIIVDGAVYSGYEICASDGTWYDFTNVSLVLNTVVTCHVAVGCGCWAYASTAGLRIARFGVSLDGDGRHLVDATLDGSTIGRADLSSVYIFKGVAAGNHTVKLRRCAVSAAASTYFYFPGFFVIAAPV